MRSCVFYLKNIIFRLKHVLDTPGHGLDMCQTQVGCVSNMAGPDSDMARTQFSTFFQLFDGLKKNSKAQKFKFI